MKERRVIFYGHLVIIDEKILIKNVLNYFDQNHKIQINWLKYVKAFKNMSKYMSYTRNRDKLGKNI